MGYVKFDQIKYEAGEFFKRVVDWSQSGGEVLPEAEVVRSEIQTRKVVSEEDKDILAENDDAPVFFQS